MKSKQRRRTLCLFSVVCFWVICCGIFLVTFVTVNKAQNEEASTQVVTSCTSRLRETTVQQQRLHRMYSACKNLGFASNDMSGQGEEIYEKGKDLILVDNVHNVALMAVPKSGSSTWKLTMLNSSGTYTVTPGMSIPIHTNRIFRQTKGIYTQIAEFMLPDEVLSALSKSCVIVHVWHPFDRLESAFADKVRRLDFKNIRTNILKARGLSDKEVEELKQNGWNIHFHEFLSYILSFDNPHWTGQFEATFTCTIPYGYIGKLETMSRDLHMVNKELLSGHGTQLKRNVIREETVFEETFTKRGRYLPLFSELEHKDMWLKTIAEVYKYDLEMFGYSYYVDSKGDVFATCTEYDNNGRCI